MSRRRESVTNEISLTSLNGYFMLLVALAVVGLTLASFVFFPAALRGPDIPLRMLVIAVGVFIAAGLYMLQPKQGAVLMLFGAYRGTDRSEGLRWANPLYVKRKISL